ncbi:nitrate reductase cytochrome c-type subunit [Thiolapillus sp.]
MKKIIHISLAAFGLLLITSNTVTAKEDIASLRGTEDLSGASLKATKKKIISQEGGFERSYKQQPPMVPHKVEKYKITLKNNGCMKCHSKKNHKKEKAPMVGESHFLSRDGKKLQKLSSRRYFCNQCHAPQIDANPLVKNEFDGLK